MTTWEGLGEEIDRLREKVAGQKEVIAGIQRANHNLHDELTTIREAKGVYVSDEQITALKNEIADLCVIRHNQAGIIHELRHEVAILEQYKSAGLLLADSWDKLCKLFEGTE